MSYTLRQGVDAYLRSQSERLALTSFVEYERVFNKMLSDLGEDTDVSVLEPPSGADLIEEFLDGRWRGRPYAFNRNLSVVHSLIKHLIKRGHLQADACLAIDRRKPDRHARTTFSDEQVRQIISSAGNPRDRVALRLLLIYGLRKGALTQLTMVNFDHSRRVLSFLTKGRKYHTVPLVGDEIWNDVREIGGHPGDYLLHRKGRVDLPLSAHGMHLWWYRRLEDADIVEPGTTSGERMHKARHTAGQRVLNSTGNLKAAQVLLGHASIQTTGDVYSDWEADQMRDTMERVDL